MAARPRGGSARQGWFSAFGKPKRGKAQEAGSAGPRRPCAVADKHGVIRDEFNADAPNRLWVADIERHEALLNRAVVEDHRRRAVAAGVVKLRAA